MVELPCSLAAVRLSSRPLANQPAVVLIGMAAVGKSTMGRELAAQLSLPFVDTDVILYETAGCSLEELLQRKGAEGFCDLEEQVVLSLRRTAAVIATGGSVIYRPQAMAHLREIGVLLWLDAPTSAIAARHRKRDPRGLVWLPTHLPTLEALIEHRSARYREAADFRVTVP